MIIFSTGSLDQKIIMKSMMNNTRSSFLIRAVVLFQYNMIVDYHHVKSQKEYTMC